jgi:LCP family protein required for cell wall assembly
MTVPEALRRVGFAVACVLAAVVILVSAYVRVVVDKVQSIGSSNAIASGPSVGAMNILLMGLESRTDYEGNILPADLLAAMHAGSVAGVENGVGGQDTNTLILIHIFSGGQTAVGFSIPRDDWVTFPQSYDGQSAGKIDQAYGLAWAQSLQATVGNSSLSHAQRYQMANEAGQRATIDTVQALTGVTIDHFAEVNLAGFYELAKAFDGIWVCVRSWDGGRNLHDGNSGFRLSSPGYHHLPADQALAFVRERDNLPNGDLDRTHRQQAVLDYVLWKLRHEGVLSSFSQLNALLDVARKYVITDSGWDLIDFASQMRTLTGKNLTFRTLPVVTTSGRMDGEDVNIINVAEIQQVVNEAFSAPPSAPSSPASAASSASTGAADASASTPPASPSADPNSTTPSNDGTGGSGGTVSAPDGAPYGIPCVY